MNFICNKIFPKVMIWRCHISVCKFYHKSWNIVFFGSDTFSLVSLKALHKHIGKSLINKLEVVTTNKITPTYKFAILNDLKISLWPPDLSGQYDFGVVVSFGKLIPLKMINSFPLGIINVHASLLPRWRGAMPIVHAIKNGDTVSGITLISINQNFDTGDIILKKSCSIGRNELMPSLHSKLAKIGSECLLEVIQGMPGCLEKSVPQPKENIIYAPKLTKESSVIIWEEMNAFEIFNLYRSLYGMFDVKTTWQGISVNFLCMSLNESHVKGIESGEKISVAPGTVTYSAMYNCLIVHCKDNSSVKICTVKLKGKIYSARKFNLGFITQVSRKLRRFGS